MPNNKQQSQSEICGRIAIQLPLEAVLPLAHVPHQGQQPGLWDICTPFVTHTHEGERSTQAHGAHLAPYQTRTHEKYRHHINRLLSDVGAVLF